MKRATALQILAGILVVVLMVSAYPLAGVVVRSLERADGSDASAGSGSASGGDGRIQLPFSDDPTDGHAMPDGSSSSTPGAASDGSSSRPAAPGAGFTLSTRSTGSVLIDQVLGAARLMGHDVALPDLPLAKLSPVDPLRHAIVAWVAATGSDVPADELARELARADALPADLQTDLAILVLSAAEATLLQKSALAALTAEEIAWIQANPQLADDLVNGVQTPDTLQLAALAAKVDMAKSVQASLLLLQAVEATSASLAEKPAALATLSALDVDPTTHALLERIEAGAGATSADKIRFAADLVALGAGLPAARTPLPTVTFPQAMDALLGATAQPVNLQELDAVLGRAALLPQDLQDALAALVFAQARAVFFANPAVATPDGQAQALVDVLDAVASALPVLEKHGLLRTAASDAMRAGSLDPAARARWAAETAAILIASNAAPDSVIRAAGFTLTETLVDAHVPERTFVEALEALALESGARLTDADRANAQRVADALEPAVRDAAATLMSGAAESSRLTTKAYSALTPEEIAFLLSFDASAVALSSSPTASDIDALRAAVALAALVDRESLVAAGLVGTRATLEARDMIAGAGAYGTQGDATPVPTGWRALLQRLLPIGTARAQSGPCFDFDTTGVPITIGDAPALVIMSDCENDVLLRITIGTLDLFQPENAGILNLDLLVITGTGSSNMVPPKGSVAELCAKGERSQGFGTVDGMFYSTGVCFRDVPRLGASKVHLDLGGDDVYNLPVAMTLPVQARAAKAPPVDDNAAQFPLGSFEFTLAGHVSLHLDAGGDDLYFDATDHLKTNKYYPLYFASLTHPTQGAAYGGGVAVLFDNAGDDQYDAADRAQGYSRYGVGALIDAAGADRYTAGNIVQGAASDGLNLGLGLLLDIDGGDRYVADRGMGYGYGGFFFDARGRDTYQNAKTPAGVPAVKLDVVPGGQLTSVDSRGDTRVWIDGPDGLNLGVGIDQDLSTGGTGDRDGDTHPDIIEFLAGSDPDDPYSNATSGPQRRADLLSSDADGDSWPDGLERAFSTNPDDAADYPAGFPSPLPAPAGPRDGAKILDLRIPLQEAGTIENACVVRDFNGTAYYAPRTLYVVTISSELLGPSRNNLGPSCTNLAYDSTGSGAGNLSLPTATNLNNNYTYSFPLGILALGDVDATLYDIDYFVALDLGGVDRFKNQAGGALGVAFANKASTSSISNLAFLAPSLVVNVDGKDNYTAANASRPAHGAFLGILIDTAGDDDYNAGAASQGSQGGLLLDLAGNDRYRAGDLSQGADLAQAPTDATRADGLPDKGEPVSQDAPARRSVPSMLLDFGGDDQYAAGAHSQGSARGYALQANADITRAPKTALEAIGILYDENGKDTYSAKGIHSQGVGATRATGILVDRAGDDKYGAVGVASQGATASDTYMAPAFSSTTREPGAGILGDTGGNDTYTYTDARRGLISRTLERQDTITVTQGGAAQTSPAATPNGAPSTTEAPTLTANRGIHLDGSQATAAGTLAGTGTTSPDAVPGFHLNMPNARLAIGTNAATLYERDYALAIDLGGDNAYNFSAGGFISDVVARGGRVQASGVGNPLSAALTLYPVTLVYDAGLGNSTYAAKQSLAQGAGFFSVGVVIDQGGADTFVHTGASVPGLATAWAPAPPIMDGVISEADWGFASPHALTLVGQNDTRYDLPIRVRAANDNDSLYLAFDIPTGSQGSERTSDRLTVAFDSFRDLSEQTRDGSVGVDAFTLRAGGPARCHDTSRDRYYNLSGAQRRYDDDTLVNFAEDARRFGCAMPSTGGLQFEVIVPLREQANADGRDLVIPFSNALGYLNTQLGLHIAFTENASGETYVWPGNTTMHDGHLTFARDARLADEMAAWGALGLANLGEAGRAPELTRPSQLAQGAGVSGVGLLAMLGQTGGHAQLTMGERGQGFGAYGGLGLLLDAGGNDLYESQRLSLGAAEVQGVGLFFELDGHDAYNATREAHGYPSGVGSVAGFYDLRGVDAYALQGVNAYAISGQSLDFNLESVATTGTYPAGNQRAWYQPTGGPVAGIGVAVDIASNDPVRSLATVSRGGLYAGSTEFKVFEWDDVTKRCTDDVVDKSYSRDKLTGIVCLWAETTLTTGRVAASTLELAQINLAIDGLLLRNAATVQGDGMRLNVTMPVDAGRYADGLHTLAATPVLRIVSPSRLTADVIEDPVSGAKLDVLVNNAPALALGLAPAYSGAADAAFSPNAIAAPRELTVAWNVSHDASEDRLELIEGYRAPAQLRNVPCAGGGLCHTLPLYFVKDGAEMTTTPPVLLAPDFVRENPGTSEFTTTTAILTTPLHISKDTPFKVYLSDRTALAAGTYTTAVSLKLVESPNGGTTKDDARNPDGTLAVLAAKNFTATPPAPTSGGVYNLLRPLTTRGESALPIAYSTCRGNAQCRPVVDGSGAIPGWTELAFDLENLNAVAVEDHGSYVTVPAGYGLRLSVRLFSATGGGVGLGQTYKQTYEESGLPRSPGNAYELWVQMTTLERNLPFGGGSVFYLGTESTPSRLEMRIPAEATTYTGVTFIPLAVNETGVLAWNGAPNTTFLGPNAVVGDLAGTPRAANGSRATEYAPAFDGALDGIALPDGYYDARLTAIDESQQARTLTKRFLLDTTSPTTRIETPPNVGAGQLEGSAVVITWSVDEVGGAASGLQRTYLYVRDGTDTWTPTPLSGAGYGDSACRKANVNGVDRLLCRAKYTPSGTDFQIMAIAVDAVGNVETVSGNHESLESALAAAVANKAFAGLYNGIRIDKTPPADLSSSMGPGRVLIHKGSEALFVRAGAPVAFSVSATDGETQVDRVDIVFEHVIEGTSTILARSYRVCESVCGAGPYTYSAWNAVNVDKTLFPDGLWAVSFQVYDAARNLISYSAGKVLLDSQAPTIHVEPVQYPAGQSTAKPGDRIVLRIDPSDAFGVDDASITVDASALTSEGVLAMRPSRVDGIIYREAALKLDRSDLADGEHVLTIRLTDQAGNPATANVVVQVDGRRFAFVPGSVNVSDVTHNALTLTWKTTEPTLGQVKFGTSPVELRSRTNATEDYATEHTLRVTNLTPSTRHFLRAVSIGTSGYTLETEVLEAVTDTALFLRPTAPAAGDRVSGLLPVRFEGGLLDSRDPVRYTLEARVAGGNATFVTTTRAPGTTHELMFNSSRYLDGVYTLTLTAENGNEKINATLGPFTSDNTRPTLDVATPRIATNDTTPRIVIEARDNLAGVAPTGDLAIDGTTLTLTAEDAGDGLTRFTHNVETTLTQGKHVLAFTLRDLAGNERTERWNLTVDGTAPLLADNGALFDPGTSAAKAGGLVTLNITVTDAGGVSTVTADTSRISTGQPLTRLFRVTGTDAWKGSFPVSVSDAESRRLVTVTATDLAGNERALDLEVLVDNVAPRTADFTVSEADFTTIVLGTVASEPVVLRGTATSAGSVVSAEGSGLSTEPRITFVGLKPSRTYTIDLVAYDRAGNPVEGSSTARTRDDATPPGTVSGLAVTDLLNGTLRLTWTPATDDVGISHYRIYRSDDGVEYRAIAETPDTQYEDPDLPLERAYTYQVVAVDHGGNEGTGGDRLRASATALPQLLSGLVTPPAGASSTTFKYTIRYVSPGGVAPVHVRVVIDGVPHAMELAGAPTYTEGATYEFESRLAPHKRDAPHTYTFEAYDGRYTVRFQDGDLLRGPLVSGDVSAERDAASLAGFAQRVPLAGALSAISGLVVAALAVALVMRKKKEGSK